MAYPALTKCYHGNSKSGNTEISVGANRRILRDAMLEEDFSYYNDEWWHFDYGNQFWAALKGYEVAIYGEIRSAT